MAVAKKLFCLSVAFFALANVASADCVNNVKSSTSFQMLDPNTILLRGNGSSGVIVKTFSFIYTPSDVQVLKDDFCDYEDAVLYIDGEVIDAQAVKSLQ